MQMDRILMAVSEVLTFFSGSEYFSLLRYVLLKIGSFRLPTGTRAYNAQGSCE
jgi:hypothetical protein